MCVYIDPIGIYYYIHMELQANSNWFDSKSVWTVQIKQSLKLNISRTYGPILIL